MNCMIPVFVNVNILTSFSTTLSVITIVANLKNVDLFVLSLKVFCFNHNLLRVFKEASDELHNTNLCELEWLVRADLNIQRRVKSSMGVI